MDSTPRFQEAHADRFVDARDAVNEAVDISDTPAPGGVPDGEVTPQLTRLAARLNMLTINAGIEIGTEDSEVITFLGERAIECANLADTIVEEESDEQIRTHTATARDILRDLAEECGVDVQSYR